MTTLGRPQKPTRQLNAYNFFFKYERERLLASLGVPEGECHRRKRGKVGFAGLARHVSKKWKETPDETRAYYYQLQNQDRERYNHEMKEYKAMLKTMEITQLQNTAPDRVDSFAESAPVPPSIPVETVSSFSASSPTTALSGPATVRNRRNVSRHLQVSDYIRNTMYGSQQNSTLVVYAPRGTEDVLEPLAISAEELRELQREEEAVSGVLSSETFNHLW